MEPDQEHYCGKKSTQRLFRWSSSHQEIHSPTHTSSAHSTPTSVLAVLLTSQEWMGWFVRAIVLLEGGVSPWQPASSLVKSLERQRALSSQDRGFSNTPLMAIQSWLDPFNSGISSSLCLPFLWPIFATLLRFVSFLLHKAPSSCYLSEGCK